MIVYCLKKIEQDGEVLYEKEDLKYWTRNVVYARFYETIEEVVSDMQYHRDRDEFYLNTLKEYGEEDKFKPCEYKVAKFELTEIGIVEEGEK